MQLFEAIINMFGKAVFEATEVEMMVYDHFPAASFYLSDHFENSLKKLHFFTKIDGRYEL